MFFMVFKNPILCFFMVFKNTIFLFCIFCLDPKHRFFNLNFNIVSSMYSILQLMLNSSAHPQSRIASDSVPTLVIKCSELKSELKNNYNINYLSTLKNIGSAIKMDIYAFICGPQIAVIVSLIIFLSNNIAIFYGYDKKLS